MLRTRIDTDFRITIPEPLRAVLKAEQEVYIAVDVAGRLILIPVARVEAILQRTAGLWRDRTDVPADGVEYVNQLRQGRRLQELGVTQDNGN